MVGAGWWSPGSRGGRLDPPFPPGPRRVHAGVPGVQPGCPRLLEAWFQGLGLSHETINPGRAAPHLLEAGRVVGGADARGHLVHQRYELVRRHLGRGWGFRVTRGLYSSYIYSMAVVLGLYGAGDLKT